MKPEGLDRLTDKQRDCLRLVYAHKQTKEIARILNLSPDGVTQRIKTAMRTLDVDSRREAAQLLAEAEGLATYPPLVHRPRDIEPSPEPAMIGSSNGDGHGRSSGDTMRESQSPFVVDFPIRRSALPLPIGGARPNDVGWIKRLAWIAGIAIGVALAFGALVSGIDTLARLIRG